MTTSSAVEETRYNFNGAGVLPTGWTIAQLGSGMAVTTTGGNLSITTGTTASAKTIVRLTNPITLRSLIKFIVESVSQRIANNNFYFEVTNAAGNTYARWHLDGTSATSAKVITANSGYANSASTVTTPTTATGNAGVSFDIALEISRTIFSGKVSNAATADSMSVVFDRKIPQPNEDYYVQIVAENGGTNPASTTTLLVDAVIVRDLTTLAVNIHGALGDLTGATSLAVNDGGTTLSIDDGAGTITVDGSVTATGITGTAAADAAVTGNPVQIAARGNAAIPTAMSTNNDITLPWLDLYGRQHIIMSAGSTLDNGITNYKLVSAATTNATSVKASAGRVYRILAFNINAANRYLKLYNKASAPSVGTDTPIATFILQPNVMTEIELSLGIYCSLGIAFALTTGITDADTGAVALNELVVNLGYA